MVCEHTARPELSGYADGELPAGERQWWDAHLGECASCREALGRIVALRAALRSHLPPREPSSAFREELRRLIRAEPREPGRALQRWRGWELGLAAAVLLAVGFGVGRGAGGGGDRETIVGQVVADHVRSLEVDHLVDVASSEHHVVKPWFAGKLDFSPPVPDLAAAGFPLVGGRVDYLGGRAVAALVYGRGPHQINLLVWPGSASAGCRLDPPIVRQGFNLSHGRAGGMEFWAISDLNPQELDQFAGVWQGEAAPGEPGCRAAAGRG